MHRRYAGLLLAIVCANAFGWGDEGHEIIAIIAQHYLEPQVRDRVQRILEGDRTKLTLRDMVHEATWADKYRDSDRDTTKRRYNRTRNWHFINIELKDGNLAAACFGHPGLPPGTPASRGPATACVVDKIDQFAAELAAADTHASERRLALQFLLHFIGDVHQPLHAADDHDAGGNDKLVSANGFEPGKLHGYWDLEFVQRLGADPSRAAQVLMENITADDVQKWARGTASDWAMESFILARKHAYGLLPHPTPSGTYQLTVGYVKDATAVVKLQLSRAGVRLAMVLNHALR